MLQVLLTDVDKKLFSTLITRSDNTVFVIGFPTAPLSSTPRKQNPHALHFKRKMLIFVHANYNFKRNYVEYINLNRQYHRLEFIYKSKYVIFQ